MDTKTEGQSFIVRLFSHILIYVAVNTNTMPSVINKPFLKHNLKYGLKSECNILPIIKRQFGNSLQHAKDPYSNFDFIGENIVVELKTRRGNHIQKGYSTFPFDTCKLEKYDLLKKQNPNLQAYVCWYWKDMNVLHYWKIHDNKKKDDEEVDHYITNWNVDGRHKSVVEVFKEDTTCISL